MKPSKGVIYPNHGRGIKKLHRWFVSYTLRDGRYIEENFDTEEACRTRSKQLRRMLQYPHAYIAVWTRERAMSEERLR